LHYTISHSRQSEEQILILIVVGAVHLVFSSPYVEQVLQTVDVMVKVLLFFLMHLADEIGV
jgi:hypothetical protein